MNFRLFPCAVLVFLCASAPAIAQENDVFRLMEDAISTTPAAEIARADIERSRAVGEQLVAGPYEFELAASGGYRRVEDPLLPDMGFSEWSLDLTRTVRLPAKQRIDSALAAVELDIARARRETLHIEERLEFVSRWNDWARWTVLTDTSRQLAEGTQRLAELEQSKVDAGSGRQVEADLMAAEAHAIQLAADGDHLRAEAARASLLQRYPGLTLPVAPPELSLSPDEITAIMASASTPMTLIRPAALEAERARLQLRRSNADRRPDPTFGVGLRNEFGGDETAIVASVSIPLGGQSRQSRVDEATASVRLAEAELRRARWRLEQTASEARRKLDRADQLLAGAQATLDLTASALDRLQAGYELGETRLDDLITVRRRLVEAARMLAEHKAERQAAYLELAVLLQQIPNTSIRTYGLDVAQRPR